MMCLSERLLNETATGTFIRLFTAIEFELCVDVRLHLHTLFIHLCERKDLCVYAFKYLNMETHRV